MRLASARIAGKVSCHQRYSLSSLGGRPGIGLACQACRPPSAKGYPFGPEHSRGANPAACYWSRISWARVPGIWVQVARLVL